VELTAVTFGLAALAGLLTTLNPCVLPVLPVIAGAASQSGRAGLFGLGFGLVIAFVGVSLAIIGGGALLGLDEGQWRIAAALLMLVFGAVLFSERAQRGFAAATGHLSQPAHGLSMRINGDHALTQTGLGILLGIAWTPCVGPTLGGAMSIAASGDSVGWAAVIMLVFSTFAVIPLIVAGLATRALFLRNGERAADWAATGRKVMGIGLFAVGLLVLTGLDRELEAALIGLMPDWLLRLTTRF